MRIFRHYNDLPDDFRGGSIAIGNFDGVHLGHQEVINTAGGVAKERDIPWGVMTFEPHPRMFFQKSIEPFRLTPFHLKARIIEELGADFLMVLHFDKKLSDLTAEAFVGDVLKASLDARHIVCGFDFVFGKNRQGDGNFLRSRGQALGFGTSSVGAVLDDTGEAISSTRIRDYLSDADPRGAARLLGRHHEISGRVVRGDERGRTIGFPTANLEFDINNRPATGVYAVRTGIDRGGVIYWRDGVANLGHRPTFGDEDRITLETHLFDFDQDIYGQHLRVGLVEYLRPERKFNGIDELTRAIRRDCTDARAVLAKERDRKN